MILRTASVLLVFADLALGQLHSYDGTSFPEEFSEDWVHIDSAFPADRWIEDGHLVQQPVLLPCPPECTTQDYYRRYIKDQAGLSDGRWFMAWQMQADSPPIFEGVAPASIVAAGSTGVVYHFTIGNNEIRLLQNPDVPLIFIPFEQGVHEFRLDLDNSVDPPTFEFSIDGKTVVHSQPAEGIYPTSDSRITFGSRASQPVTTVRWDWIAFGDPVLFDGAPVPAASSWSMAILSLLLLCGSTIVIGGRYHRDTPLPYGRGSEKLGS